MSSSDRREPLTAQEVKAIVRDQVKKAEDIGERTSQSFIKAERNPGDHMRFHEIDDSAGNALRDLDWRLPSFTDISLEKATEILNQKRGIHPTEQSTENATLEEDPNA